MSNETPQLKQWLASLRTEQVRAVESSTNARIGSTPARLRGARITHRLYLGRHRQFFIVVEGIAYRISPTTALRFADLATIQARFNADELERKRERRLARNAVKLRHRRT